VEQRGGDELTLARPLAREERHRDPVGQLHGRRAVGHPHTRSQRPAVGPAPPGEDPGQPLEEQIVARPQGERPLGAVRGDPSIDEPLVEVPERGVVITEPLGHAGAEVLDGDVDPADQIPYYLAPPWMADVQRDAPLVAVERKESPALAARNRRLGERPARLVAVERLHLDHFRALIGQVQGGSGRRPHLSKVKDADSRERLHA